MAQWVKCTSMRTRICIPITTKMKSKQQGISQSSWHWGASLAALGSVRDSATINRQINRRKTPDSRLPVHVWKNLSLTCHHVPHMNTHLKIEGGSLYLYANPTPRTSWVSSESPFGERRNEAPQDIPAASLLLKLCFRRFCVFRQGPL